MHSIIKASGFGFVFRHFLKQGFSCTAFFFVRGKPVRMAADFKAVVEGCGIERAVYDVVKVYFAVYGLLPETTFGTVRLGAREEDEKKQYDYDRLGYGCPHPPIDSCG